MSSYQYYHTSCCQRLHQHPFFSGSLNSWHCTSWTFYWKSSRGLRWLRQRSQRIPASLLLFSFLLGCHVHCSRFRLLQCMLKTKNNIRYRIVAPRTPRLFVNKFSIIRPQIAKYYPHLHPTPVLAKGQTFPWIVLGTLLLPPNPLRTFRRSLSWLSPSPSFESAKDRVHMVLTPTRPTTRSPRGIWRRRGHARFFGFESGDISKSMGE